MFHSLLCLKKGMDIIMKKIISLLLGIMLAVVFTACTGKSENTTLENFPQIQGTDFNGNVITNDIFKDYDATLVNVWINSCVSCLEEMPDLEGYYNKFKEKNINVIGIAGSAGDSPEMRAFAENVLNENEITFLNVIPDVESSFYNDFICTLLGFPITYIVDGEGNVVGEPIMGVVKNQEDKLMKRLDAMIGN